LIHINKPIAFVLVSTNHGTMIVNKNDYRDSTIDGKNIRNGVGHQLLTTSSYEEHELEFVIGLIIARRAHHGDGVVVIDCGANIGILSIEWARFMTGWGRVISFEAQAKIFYALAGNIVLNNCLNIDAFHAAIGNKVGTMAVPEPNYLVPSSYGSLDLEERPNNMDIGQKIDYAKTVNVDLKTIDSLGLERVDFIKIDVEGMEEAVLEGANVTIRKLKPIFFIEVLKSNPDVIHKNLSSLGYEVFPMGMNSLAVHKDDPTLKDISTSGNSISIKSYE
jgi:FkbM family methyltransferase